MASHVASKKQDIFVLRYMSMRAALPMISLNNYIKTKNIVPFDGCFARRARL